MPGPPAETPGSIAEFLGGPHDGLTLSMEEIPRWCHLVRVEYGVGKDRHFALMPPPQHWEQVVRNNLPKKGPFDSVYWYELLRSDGTFVFVLRGSDEVSAGIQEW
jgi:hypothetical protein